VTDARDGGPTPGVRGLSRHRSVTKHPEVLAVAETVGEPWGRQTTFDATSKRVGRPPRVATHALRIRDAAIVGVPYTLRRGGQRPFAPVRVTA
jgi:hypothetical protein